MRASALKFLPWRVAFRVEEGEAVGAVGAGLGGGKTKEGETEEEEGGNYGGRHGCLDVRG